MGEVAAVRGVAAAGCALALGVTAGCVFMPDSSGQPWPSPSRAVGAAR